MLETIKIKKGMARLEEHSAPKAGALPGCATPRHCHDNFSESTALPIINDGTRYNFLLDMPSLRYALVAYVKSPVGEFVENLRRELHPDLPHLAAHLTFLPPRPLQGAESAALQVLARICGRVEPFEVTLGDMETFVPTTLTVYIRVAHGGVASGRIARPTEYTGAGFRRRVALYPAPNGRENGDGASGGTGSRNCPRTLAAVLRKPPHPARPPHFCAGRRAKLLGGPGSGAARRHLGIALRNAEP